MNRETLENTFITPEIKESWRFFDFNRVQNITKSSSFYKIKNEIKNIKTEINNGNNLKLNPTWELLLKNAKTENAQINFETRQPIEKYNPTTNSILNINFNNNGSYTLILDGHDTNLTTSLFIKLNLINNISIEFNLILVNISKPLFLNVLGEIFDSSLKFNFINLNSSFIRFEPNFKLLTEKSKLEFNSLNKLAQNEFCDTSSNISHFSSFSESNQIQKNIVDDFSKVIFTGNIFIDKNLNNINSAQLSRNILISENAQALSRPQLEIYSFDVKCAHGSSTGQLNDDEFFYFSSSGIKPDTAKKFLLKAQANEIFLKIENIDIRNQLIEWVQL